MLRFGKNLPTLVTSSCRIALRSEKQQWPAQQMVANLSCAASTERTAGTLTTAVHPRWILNGSTWTRVQRRLLSPGAGSDQPSDMSVPRLVLSRQMEEIHTQMFGLVHGGLQVQLMDEAGTVFSGQYCNQTLTQGLHPGERPVMALATVEKVEYLSPMFIGEVAEVTAAIGYTTTHTMQVLLTVYANREGDTRPVSRGKFWYVPLGPGKDKRVLSLTQNATISDQARREGAEAYRALKQLRETKKPRMVERYPWADGCVEHEPGTVNFSRTMFNHPVHPSSCWPGEMNCRGGVTMKLMDECAALAAITHSSYYSYTAGIQPAFFQRRVKISTDLQASSKLIFTSKRSMEIAVTVDELRLERGIGVFKTLAAEAIYTFIAPDETGQPQDIPPLKLTTDEEKRLFEVRRNMYEERKKAKQKENQ